MTSPKDRRLGTDHHKCTTLYRLNEMVEMEVTKDDAPKILF